MRHFQDHKYISVALLLSNNLGAMVLERAKKFNVPVQVFNRAQFRESQPTKQAGGEVLAWLKEAGTTHIVLAGFLWLVPESLLKAYPEKIINIHPALLPKYGGKGMYGGRVHETVKASGDSETGITIHLVNNRFDEGKILFQSACKINPSDTPETIAAKVHELEHKYYPTEIEKWCLKF